MKFKLIVLGIITSVLISCTAKEKSIIEVTTFKLKSTVSTTTFNALDATVESDFTSKQPGFIKRQSGLNEKGEYVVVVYWKTVKDAKASMDKFMADTAVADYASMIDGGSMKMDRYTTDSKYNANTSEFVEVMSFDTQSDIDMAKFNTTNKKVATDFTAKQNGFLQRITGVSENGKQVVVVYWDNKTNSDVALKPFMEHPISKEFMGMMNQSSIHMGRYESIKSLKNKIIEISKKDKVVALLHSFNTGDQTPISYINPEKYIQHNLAVADGLQGFGEVMHHAPEGGFKANIIRAFEDGDYVVTHTEYDFFGPKAGFDVFRFEDGKIVEHWDNLTEITPPNLSGRTQFDGTTEITDLNQTEANKKIVKQFADEVLVHGKMDNLTTLVNPKKYIQHNSAVADGLDGLGAALKYFAEHGLVMKYDKVHKVIGQGNFVLTMSEGKFGKGDHVAYYDLFRVENGQIVEHWDVIAPIPAKADWKNENGKF